MDKETFLKIYDEHKPEPKLYTQEDLDRTAIQEFNKGKAVGYEEGYKKGSKDSMITFANIELTTLEHIKEQIDTIVHFTKKRIKPE